MLRNFKIVFFILIVSMSLILVSCANNVEELGQIKPKNDIQEIILDKGEDYNYLEDEVFIKEVEKFIYSIHEDINREHFAIGHLSDANIPEVVVFIERDLDDQTDEGKLLVYQFDGSEYSLLDNISMNYDNTNYQLAIGKISEDQNGLYLNNQVGAHSGMTYGFILEDNKLKSILNDKKLNLLSAYTHNEIRDINGDGVLEFSIFTIDPESEDSDIANADKLLLWYRWNEKDSAELVEIEKFSNEETLAVSRGTRKNHKLINEANDLMLNNYDEFFNFMTENVNKLDKDENTQIVRDYINYLKVNKNDINNKLSFLLKKYDIKSEQLYINKLNDKEFIDHNGVFENKEDLQKFLSANLDLGYQIIKEDDKAMYDIDYLRIKDFTEDYILQEYKEYLDIKSLDTHIYTARSKDIASKLAKIEHFRNIYPYSDFLEDVESLYGKYFKIYLYGDRNVGKDFSEFDEKSIKQFKYAIDKYENTHFANILSELLKFIEDEEYKLNEEMEYELIKLFKENH